MRLSQQGFDALALVAADVDVQWRRLEPRLRSGVDHDEIEVGGERDIPYGGADGDYRVDRYITTPLQEVDGPGSRRVARPGLDAAEPLAHGAGGVPNHGG